MRNKGQVFLIISVIIVITLIMLRLTVNIPEITEQQKEVESRFAGKFFVNTVEELKKAVEISANQPANITTNVFTFANFTNQRMTARTNDFEFLYVATYSQKTGTTLNVSAINLLRKPINVTLTFNSSPEQTANFDNFLNASRRETTFTITQGNDYKLTISYNGTYNENMTLVTKNGKSYYTAFFDVALIGSETTYRNKFQQSYKLRV